MIFQIIIIGNAINEMDFEEMGWLRKKEKMDTEMTENLNKA